MRRRWLAWHSTLALQHTGRLIREEAYNQQHHLVSLIAFSGKEGRSSQSILSVTSIAFLESLWLSIKPMLAGQQFVASRCLTCRNLLCTWEEKDMSHRLVTLDDLLPPGGHGVGPRSEESSVKVELNSKILIPTSCAPSLNIVHIHMSMEKRPTWALRAIRTGLGAPRSCALQHSRYSICGSS